MQNIIWLIIQILLSASIVWLKASHALLWKHFRFALQLRTVSKRNQPKSWYEYAGSFKGPFTQAIFIAATQCNFCRNKIALGFKHVRNPCDIAATNRTWFILHLRFWSCNFSATKFASSCCDKNRLCKRALRQNTLISIWMNWRVNALFVWFIVHLDFLSRKELLRTRHVRVFFFGHLPLPKVVGRSKGNDRCRLVLEYSLTGRYSTLSENEAFPWYALRLYLKISLHFLSGLLVRRVNF